MSIEQTSPGLESALTREKISRSRHLDPSHSVYGYATTEAANVMADSARSADWMGRMSAAMNLDSGAQRASVSSVVVSVVCCMNGGDSQREGYKESILFCLLSEDPITVIKSSSCLFTLISMWSPLFENRNLLLENW